MIKENQDINRNNISFYFLSILNFLLRTYFFGIENINVLKQAGLSIMVEILEIFKCIPWPLNDVLDKGRPLSQ